MALSSEIVLDNWCAERIYDYAQQNGIRLTLPQAHALLEINPDAPYGWLFAQEMAAHAVATTDLACDSIGPYLYWSKECTEEDANIYRDDGYADVFITRSVDHETMCAFLNDLLETSAEAIIV